MFTKDVKVDLNIEGLHFNQFVLYLKDMNYKIVSGNNRQEAHTIYKGAVQAKNTSKLVCSDFIEVIRKYKFFAPME